MTSLRFLTSRMHPRPHTLIIHHSIVRPLKTRSISDDAQIARSSYKSSQEIRKVNRMALPCLSVMPTPILLRSLFVTSMLSSPRLINIGLPIMKSIANSKLWLFNADRNPFLHWLVRKLIYNHFCGGENDAEVRNTVAKMKAMGYEGVILGYAKETVVSKDATPTQAISFSEAGPKDKAIQDWRDGNLRTLNMLGPRDFLAIKFTGAGPTVTRALALGEVPPVEVDRAMIELCEKAARQNTRLWIDAEQQLFQSTIDNWTINLMRKYNRNGDALVYTTMQAYLKAIQSNVKKHIELAQKEGWVLGIKLVRGAYIASEPRHLIHDTEQDTHSTYNQIVQNLLSLSFLGITQKTDVQNVQLFLASHNAESVKKAYSTWRSRKEAGLKTIKLEFGQLQGMADEVSCGLVQLRQQMSAEQHTASNQDLAPKAFKCLSWGTTQECMNFLFRRAIENRAAVDRTRHSVAALRQELWRRIKVIAHFE